MTTTTYYNLNIVEGTDIVNPLTVDNPNYEKIDETMHNNAVAGVTLATEIANATVHAITRENSDCSVIRFIATSRWKAGDTATVDGVPVTALLPSGETLPDGAYVINANVLCILTGTNLTVYLGSKKAENANEIPYNDTTVGAELTKINSDLTVDTTNLASNYSLNALLQLLADKYFAKTLIVFDGIWNDGYGIGGLAILKDTNSVGGWSLSNGLLNSTSVDTSGALSSGFMLNKATDFIGFDTLNVTYIYNGVTSTISVDVSAIENEAYIAMAQTCMRGTMKFYVSVEPNNNAAINDDSLAINSATTGGGIVSVKKIWLD